MLFLVIFGGACKLGQYATDRQDVDNFKMVENSKTTQLTIIVSFAKLDVIVESKNRNNFLISSRPKIVVEQFDGAGRGANSQSL